MFFRYLQYSPDSFNQCNLKIADYIADHPEYYKTYLKSLKSVGVEARDSVEITVCIPVAAHQEGNLTFTLNQYKKQTLDRDKFEIVLFLNCPQKLSTVEIRNAARNHKEVANFIASNPDFPITVIYGNVSSHEGTANIGYIRKILNDWALWRHRDRFNQDNFDIIICPHDADLDNLDKSISRKNINKFKKTSTKRYIFGKNYIF